MTPYQKLQAKIAQQDILIADQQAQIKMLTAQSNELRWVKFQFEKLLDGMCMGMKEANLPRRQSP